MKIQQIFPVIALCALIACKPTGKQPETPADQPANTETSCFFLAEGQDTTICQLSFAGDSVSGYFGWEPYERDGARGSLTGTRSGALITVVFDYMIEGSIQAEEMVLKIEGNKLLKATGELEDRNGILVLKDKTNLQFGEPFNATDCSLIADAVERAQMVTEAIRSGN